MDTEPQRRWQIGDLAKLTGVSTRALRHYDELGLLQPSERSAAGLPPLCRGRRAPPVPHRRPATARLPARREYVEGDLRRLPVEDDRFDAVFNWRTSFGFFDDEGNSKQLQEFARVRRPGGRLAMDLHSRDDVVRRMPARGGLLSIAMRDDGFLIERTQLGRADARSKTERIVVRDGWVRRLRFSLATPPAAVLQEWLHDAGFGRVELYGHGEPLRVDSRRLVAVAER